MNSFKNKHPLFLAVYFLSVLIFTMFLSHPIILLTAFFGGLLFCLVLDKPKSFFKSLLIFLPLFLVIALSNPLFSHNGNTVLFFLNSNPITLEALLYGFNLAVMLTAVIYWFKCFNIIFTSDKLLYLFGKFSPEISILLSSSLRFIPLFKRQTAKIKDTQKAMGLYSNGSLIDKFKGHIRVYSALTTWALENAVDAGASMKARGFGTDKRTNFSIFKFKKQDIALMVLTVFIDAVLCLIISLGGLDFSFYPVLTQIDFNFYTVAAIALFLILCFLPFLTELKEAIKWKYLRSKI